MKRIRMGIFGLNRGLDNATAILLNNIEIVAVCDCKEERRKNAAEKLGDVAVFGSFDEFIEYGMDAVYIANYFPEHAPFVIKALERNIHVICECLAAGTMKECVELVRAAEKSRAIYMLAENYPYMLFNQEMQKVYADGTLGKILFGEGEYNHPVNPEDTAFVRKYNDSLHHWRNYLPATYYITHSLGPLMMATKVNPVRVTALPICSPKDDRYASASMCCDGTAVITMLNDDRSVFRVTGCAKFGSHENSYRLACKNGQIENVRGTDGKVMLTYNPWSVPEGRERVSFYTPSEDAEDGAAAARTGHAGGDYYMFKDFLRCIETGEKPYLDVYAAVRMAAVGILAHRSLLEGGKPYDIPDFTKEEDRVKYENDNLSPFWTYGDKAPTMQVGSDPDYRPSEVMVKKFLHVIGQDE